jgi:hypothetical protein
VTYQESGDVGSKSDNANESEPIEIEEEPSTDDDSLLDFDDASSSSPRVNPNAKGFLSGVAEKLNPRRRR